MTDERPVCWVLTDGKAGTENQCLGLAEALGIPFAVHRLRRRPATDWVPAGFWAATGTLARTFAATAPGLRPPWPTLLFTQSAQSCPKFVRHKAAKATRSIDELTMSWC